MHISVAVNFTDEQICAIDNDVDTCKGDSGGPMTVTRRNLDRGRGMNFLV